MQKIFSSLKDLVRFSWKPVAITISSFVITLPLWFFYNFYLTIRLFDEEPYRFIPWYYDLFWLISFFAFFAIVLTALLCFFFKNGKNKVFILVTGLLIMYLLYRYTGLYLNFWFQK